MAELTDIERRGRHAVLSRHYEGDGRWGRRSLKPYSHMGWIVQKYRPSGDRIWYRSTGKNAKLVHAGKYQLVATHANTGTVQKLTVWLCGGQCYSDVESVENPESVCAKCKFALDKKSTVPLTN